MDKAARAALLTAKGMDSKSENIADYVADLLRQGRASEVTDDLMAQADPQRLHQHYTSGNTGMNLPMDYASRMERAAKMGYAAKATHGTGAQISHVDPKYFGHGRDLLGSGFYTTGNPARAERYVPREKTSGTEISKNYIEGGNTLPVMLREPKPFNLAEPLGSTANDIASLYSEDPFFSVHKSPSGMVHINDADGKSVSLDPAQPKHWALQRLREGFGPSETSNALSALGYSGVNGPESGESSVKVSYNPEDVRSQFARFDPRLEHLAHLSASTGGAMEFARHVEAIHRAGGQIAPSKYLPDVPRAVHAGGGRENGQVVNLGKEKLVRSITKAVADVKSGAHQENMDRRAYKLHESGHLPLPIGTKVTPPQGWDMPSELHIHGYWQDILHPDQHGYKLKSENGDVYEVQHQMHLGQNPYVFGGGFRAYSGPIRNRAGYSDEAMASKNPILPTRTSEQSTQLNKEYDQLFGSDPDITKADGGRVGYDNGGSTPEDQGSRTGFPELDSLITDVGNLNKMFNPVEAAGQSMEASKRMLAPDTSGWGRAAAAGDMLTSMAGAALPFASAARPAAAAAREVKPLVEGFEAYQGSPHNFPAERLVRMPDGSTQHIVGAPDVLPDVPAGAQVLQDYPLGRMRMDKIGTGEGAQHYGYGLYGAELEDVARNYRDTLSQNNKFTPYVTYKAEEFLKNAGGDYQKAADAAKRMLTGNLDRQQAHEIGEVARLLNANSVSNGRMYHIHVKADPNEFINYDAPFHEQPKNVQAFFAHMANEQPHGSVLAKSIKTPEHAATAAQAGIPGVRYLDQGSRYTPSNLPNNPIANEARTFLDQAKGNTETALKLFNGSNPSERFATTERDEVRKVIEAAKRIPTRNYVLFNDKPISILRKYKDGGDVEPITAYHGSPHSFDQFDISKIGTGEGNQAYGHGLYFAGNEKVAKHYRDMLSNRSPKHISDFLQRSGLSPDISNAYSDFAASTSGGKGSLDDFKKILEQEHPYPAINNWRKNLLNEISKLNDAISRLGGHMYKVKINAKPEELLDWDKPLSEQHPNVQAVLRSFGAKPEDTGAKAYLRAGTHKFSVVGPNGKYGPGGSTYEESLAQAGGDPSKVRSILDTTPQARSAGLLAQGIKGIRYRDAGSRDLSDGDPTHNYVMFHHDPVQVTDKYEYGGTVAIPKARDVSAALALTRRFTKDGTGATLALKSKGK